ncbi:MAG: HEAT repeat domain-containing protein [Gemmatimonadota bacterium]
MRTASLFPFVLAALCACSTTEQQVEDQIALLAANKIGSAAWNGAVEHLVGIGRPSARQLMILLDPALYKGLRYTEFRDEMTRLRTAAAEVLGRIGHTAASASLDDRVTTAYEYPERVASIRAVGELGWFEAAATALEAQLKDADPTIRLYSAVALLKIEEQTGVDTIRSAVQSSDPELAELAIAEMEGANYFGVPLLVELRQQSGPRRERLGQAIQVVESSLLSQLGSDDPEVRRRSARALGTIGDPAMADRLYGLLGDSSNLVRFNAASSLSQLGDARGTDFLFEALRDQDPILRVNAVKSLIRVQLTSESVQGRLIEGLGGVDPLMRSGAAQVLGEACVTAAVDPLVGALADPVPEVRCNAVIALGHIGAPRTREAVQQLAGDPDQTVAYYAAWALNQFGAGS